MSSSVVEDQVKGTLPTSGGCGVFIGNDEKIIIIYVDQMVGNAIMMFLKDLPKERPQTHDLFEHVLESLGAKVERVIVNDYKDSVYYGRLIISAENEIKEKKIIEIDARSSDCIALAIQSKSPIYVAKSVMEVSEDVSDIFRKVESGNILSQEDEDQ